MALQGSSQRLDHLSESDSHSVLGEGLSQGGPSPISTPLLPGKRKTNDRKLRPKSVVDNGEGYGPREPGKYFLVLVNIFLFISYSITKPLHVSHENFPMKNHDVYAKFP